jgi:purine-binding chemotaxis protein CheW
LPAETIQPPNESIAGLSGKYLRGIAIIGERLILLLDIKEVLTSVTNEEEKLPALSAQNA